MIVTFVGCVTRCVWLTIVLITFIGHGNDCTGFSYDRWRLWREYRTNVVLFLAPFCVLHQNQLISNARRSITSTIYADIWSNEKECSNVVFGIKHGKTCLLTSSRYESRSRKKKRKETIRNFLLSSNEPKKLAILFYGEREREMGKNRRSMCIQLERDWAYRSSVWFYNEEINDQQYIESNKSTNRLYTAEIFHLSLSLFFFSF